MSSTVVELVRRPAPPAAELAGLPALKRIRARESIRVGYLPGNLPWSHFNQAGDLAGFDVEMAHGLACDLDVALEFVPVDPERLAKALDSGYCDVVMAGIEVTVERAERMAFTTPSVNETLAVLVRDHRRSEFDAVDKIEEMDSATFAVRTERYYMERIADYLPKAQLVPLHSFTEFFEAPEGEYDALVTTAETGSAWTLLYPDFSVVVPKGGRIEVPLAYAVSLESPDLLTLLNTWIDLKRRDGSVERAYDYWVRGLREGRTTLVPFIFEVPREVVSSPVSLASSILPSKLISYVWSPNSTAIMKSTRPSWRLIFLMGMVPYRPVMSGLASARPMRSPMPFARRARVPRRI